MSPDRRVVLAATLAGIGVALVVTLLQGSTYRAEGTLVLTREDRAPGDDPTLAPAAAAAVELLETRAVADAVAANLRLDESGAELLDRIDVDAGAQSSLLRVSVEGDAPEGARRVAREVTEVFTVLYNTRFGPGVTASIWETPAADEDRVSPRPARNLALGALLGALVGLGLGSRRPPPRAEERIVSSPPSPPSPRPLEQTLPEPPPQPEEPAPQPAPQPTARGPFVRPEPGSWRLADVEALLAEQGDVFPAQRAEFDTYLASFRDVADPDGHLPGGVQSLVEEVFAEPLEAARRRAERDRWRPVP